MEKNFFVVGIGASAGGLEALELFFKNAPKDSGLAYVVVQHLSPDYKSLMDELLSKHTDIPIVKVTDETKIEANHVYLNPPKRNIIFQNGMLKLIPQDTSKLNLPIDIFLESLAEGQEERAVAVVLSGTGSDGTRGIRSIKGSGGLVIVQDPKDAKFGGMPSSAISTGLVDKILPVGQIPVEIVKYLSSPFHINSSEVVIHKDTEFLNKIFMRLKEVSGIDFAFYKESTILRRIERRMSVNQIETIYDYYRYIGEFPSELNILKKEFLIGVTRFFRDEDAFEIIRNKVIPDICSDKSSTESIRCWCVGCSTGEEAYSVAMHFKDYMEKNNKLLNVKIFATDVDKDSIELGSEGIYPISIVADVGQEYLKKYFSKHGTNYIINKEIRDMVIFAVHNIIKDPPFNKLDLIICRNLLIYLKPEAQKKILSHFQFSLTSSGLLFLGNSETVGDLNNYFEVYDGKWKIYKRNKGPKINIGQVALTHDFSKNVFVRRKPASETLDVQSKFMNYLKDIIIDSFLPPTIIMNINYQPIIFFGDVNKYVQFPKGEANFNVLNLLHKEIAVALSSAIHKSTKTKEDINYKNIKFNFKDYLVHVDLRLKVIKDSFYDQELYIISFIEREPDESKGSLSEEFDLDKQARQRIQDLEQELQYTRESLQATIEELETTNEELQATNEELMSSNEELQSTNEELQSVNEELITVNSEYQAKIQELVELSEDIDNILSSTGIGTIFLDNSLLVRKFTPIIANTVNLIDLDIGRPINHITHNLEYDSFVNDVISVLQNQNSIEMEVKSKYGRWYLMRIFPYKTKHNLIKGVVITFIDISDKIVKEN